MMILRRDNMTALSGRVFCNLLLASGLVSSLLAADPPAREKVRFSDSKPASLPSELSVRRSNDRGMDGVLDRGSSLGAVTAIPFRPSPSTSGRVLSPKEKEELEKRSNWLDRGNDDQSLSDKSVHEALGVNSLDQDPYASQRSKGSIERYFDRAVERDQKEVKELRKENESTGRDSRADQDLVGSVGTGSDAGLPGAMDRGERMERSDRPGQMADYRELGSSGFSAHDPMGARESVRDSLSDTRAKFSMNGSRSFFGAEQTSKMRTDEFKKNILGQSPSDSPLGNPLGKGSDPVNLVGDLTRQSLNPVMGEAFSGGAKVSFSDPTVGGGIAKPSVGSGFAEMLSGPGSSLVPVGAGPVIAPMFEPRKIHSSPTVLDIPRRSF
jgi:hypothetical protein